MATKRAKVLNADQVAEVLAAVEGTAHAARDRLKLLLSFRQGLRAAEIAGLAIEDVVGPDGSITDAMLFVSGRCAKGKRDREIPLHPEVKAALVAYLAGSQRVSGPVILNDRGGGYSPNAMTQWFSRFYKSLGYVGCSSHSGRRTCLTTLARRLSEHGCSIVDLQLVAGHADLKTTRAYLEPSPRVASLLSSL